MFYDYNFSTKIFVCFPDRIWNLVKKIGTVHVGESFFVLFPDGWWLAYDIPFSCGT